MPRLPRLLVLLLLLSPTFASQAGAPVADARIASLAWLTGGWGSEQDGRWTEEWWTPPRFGQMLGVNQSGRDGKKPSHEFLRISLEADGSIVYWGGPEGAVPTPFKLTSQSAGSVVFENPKHDFPQKIEYRLSATTLTATVSGSENGKVQSMSWTWQRIAER